MKVSLLCSSADHPVNAWLERWVARRGQDHDVALYRDKSELPGGDVLFLVSCSQLIGADLRALYRHTLVLHASDLPRGRGWSPHIWALLAGEDHFTVTLLDAEDAVDSGAIWAQREVAVPAHALHHEINERLFEAELALMDEGLSMVAAGQRPRPQDSDIPPTYYRKRTPQDSEIDPHRSLAEQFDAIRVADPERYPAFFRLHGHTYTLEIKKVDDDDLDQH